MSEEIHYRDAAHPNTGVTTDRLLYACELQPGMGIKVSIPHSRQGKTVLWVTEVAFGRFHVYVRGLRNDLKTAVDEPYTHTFTDRMQLVEPGESDWRLVMAVLSQQQPEAEVPA